MPEVSELFHCTCRGSTVCVSFQNNGSSALTFGYDHGCARQAPAVLGKEPHLRNPRPAGIAGSAVPASPPQVGHGHTGGTGWGGRARGKLPPKLCPVLQELQASMPRLREVRSPAWVAVVLISFGDVRHLFVPAVKPLLALHQVFSHLSASAGAEFGVSAAETRWPS